MPLFGKRKAEQQEEQRRQEELQRNYRQAQDAFTQGFLAWLKHVKRAQTETGSAVLTDDIVAGGGRIPPIQTDALNDTQRIMMRAFARSFAGASMERARAGAIVAAGQARDSGTGDDNNVRNVISFWDSVDHYLGTVLR